MHVFSKDQIHQFADNRLIYNFCPGPCVLPKAVLDVAHKEWYNYRGSGQTVLELAHRQDEFRFISVMTKKEIKRFLQVPDNFRIMI